MVLGENKHQGIYKSALSFEPEAVEANARGRLTLMQRSVLKHNFYTAMVPLIIIVFVTIGSIRVISIADVFASGGAAITFTLAVIAYAALTFSLTRWMLSNYRSLSQPKIDKIEGIVEVYFTTTYKGSRNDWITVNGRKFSGPNADLRPFVSGEQYVIYYTSHGNTLLSAKLLSIDDNSK